MRRLSHGPRRESTAPLHYRVGHKSGDSQALRLNVDLWYGHPFGEGSLAFKGDD